jgi:Ca2+-binding RTX toxin-like protein
MVPNQFVTGQIDAPTSWNLLANAVDPNPGGTLDFSTINIVTPPNDAQLSADPNTGNFILTPDWLLTGTQPTPQQVTPFQFTIRDNLGAISNVATITINSWVSPGKFGFIVAGDGFGVTHTLQPVTVNVVSLAVVNDGSQVDPTSVALVPGTGPQHGSVSINPLTGLITYTPGLDAIGFDYFSYTIKDTLGHESGANVFIVINPTATPRLQADALLGGQMLVVDGTPNDDTILVKPGTHAGDVLVSVNGITSGPFHPTSRMVIFGYGGNNHIQVSKLVTVPAWLVGGTGNGTLIAGGGPSILIGGRGNDTLVAGSGRDLFIGGGGADELIGNRNDILVAGTTSFDADQASLNAIMREWNSTDIYSRRVESLTGQVNKSWSKRLNGNVFLNLSTIHADGGHDTLFCAPEELIFATLGGANADSLMDRDARDVIFALSGNTARH